MYRILTLGLFMFAALWMYCPSATAQSSGHPSLAAAAEVRPCGIRRLSDCDGCPTSPDCPTPEAAPIDGADEGPEAADPDRASAGGHSDGGGRADGQDSRDSNPEVPANVAPNQGRGDRDLNELDSYYDRLSQRSLASGSRSEFASFGHNSIGDMLSLPSYIHAINFDHGGIVGNTVFMVSSELPTGKRIKATENNNPLPQDRIFCHYNHFHHAFQSDATLTVFDSPIFSQSFGYDASMENVTLGFEKTFSDGLWSIDVRMPLHSEVAYTTFRAFQLRQTSNLEEVYVAPKILLHAWETGAVSAGLGMSIPTGSGITGTVGTGRFEIRNESFHLAPFLGYIASPVERVYLMLWGQLDFDTTGSEYVTSLTEGVEITNVLHDTSAAYASASLAWFLRENRSDRWLTDLAGIFELHYSATIGPQDFTVDSGGSISDSSILYLGSIDQYFEPLGTASVLNMTAGFHYELAGGLNGRIAGVVPLTTGRDALFPFELVVQTEWRF